MSNKVALTSALINSAPTKRDLLELPELMANWTMIYGKVSGKSQAVALMKYEAEKILFLSAIMNNKQLQECDNFSIYTAFTELSVSGGTLRDGLCYIVPFKGKAVFMPGWKFRLEQVNEIPNVVHCQEPVVVYDCDEFEWERGMKTIIKVHRPGVRTAANVPLYVYWVIEFDHGPEVYVMDALQVLQIRDRYSKSYQDYVKKKATGKWEHWMEEPMWVKDEHQAFQKTIVRWVWKHLPKLAKTLKHKAIDSRIAANGLNEETDIEELGKLEELDELIIKPDEPGQDQQQTGQPVTGQQATQANGIEDLAYEEAGSSEKPAAQASAPENSNPDIPF